jgi:hypothetical protein
MSKLDSIQEEMNDSIIDLMCLTFDKEEMKKLIKVYVLTNSVTDNIKALKKTN